MESWLLRKAGFYRLFLLFYVENTKSEINVTTFCSQLKIKKINQPDLRNGLKAEKNLKIHFEKGAHETNATMS